MPSGSMAQNAWSMWGIGLSTAIGPRAVRRRRWSGSPSGQEWQSIAICFDRLGISSTVAWSKSWVIPNWSGHGQVDSSWASLGCLDSCVIQSGSILKPSSDWTLRRSKLCGTGTLSGGFIHSSDWALSWLSHITGTRCSCPQHSRVVLLKHLNSLSHFIHLERQLYCRFQKQLCSNFVLWCYSLADRGGFRQNSCLFGPQFVQSVTVCNCYVRM